jgi:hypothetical protein
MAPSRILDGLAAIALAIAVVVIVVTPQILAAPNPLSTPSAFIVAIAAAAALAGGRWGRRIAVGLSAAGLLLSALWYWLASDGFGTGTPWYDDMAEAAILVVAFLAAIVLLTFARRAARGQPESAA